MSLVEFGHPHVSVICSHMPLCAAVCSCARGCAQHRPASVLLVPSPAGVGFDALRAAQASYIAPAAAATLPKVTHTACCLGRLVLSWLQGGAAACHAALVPPKAAQPPWPLRLRVLLRVLLAHASTAAGGQPAAQPLPRLTGARGAPRPCQDCAGGHCGGRVRRADCRRPEAGHHPGGACHRGHQEAPQPLRRFLVGRRLPLQPQCVATAPSRQRLNRRSSG